MSDTKALLSSSRLLSLVGSQSGDAADDAYQHIVRRIEQAEVSVEIHMYVWRADAVGYLIGQAVYDAAERGVKVKILKDRGAVLFESQESNRKPFFKTPRAFSKRVLQRGLGLTFPSSLVEDDWDQSLGDKLMDHPNVDFVWVSPTHTKYYCIDETYLITGSLNLEERHRGYHDVMVELTGMISSFREMQGNLDCKPPLLGGDLCILMNDTEKKVFAIKSAVLDLIDGAHEKIHIEMAYLGDEDVTHALIAAGERGVKLSILFSEKSNIGNDVNYHVLRTLMKRSGIEVRLSSKMIHSKVMVVDDRKVLMGSANFSVFSMQRAGELCFIVEDPTFVDQVLCVLGERWCMGLPVDKVGDLPHYWRTLARLQQWHQRTSRHQ